MATNSRGPGTGTSQKARDLFFQSLLNSNPAQRVEHERVLSELAAGKRVMEYHPSTIDRPEQLDTPLAKREFTDDAKGNSHLPVLHDEIEYLLDKGVLVRKRRTDENRLVWPVGLHPKQEKIIKGHYSQNKKME
ncbi:MAG: hypothetical protein WCX64_03475 [Candidatus Micrarchaeia archaeon]